MRHNANTCVTALVTSTPVKLNIKASFPFFPNAVPVRDDGDMPDVPAHPCEPKGNNLEWLKNL